MRLLPDALLSDSRSRRSLEGEVDSFIFTDFFLSFLSSCSSMRFSFPFPFPFPFSSRLRASRDTLLSFLRLASSSLCLSVSLLLLLPLLLVCLFHTGEIEDDSDDEEYDDELLFLDFDGDLDRSLDASRDDSPRCLMLLS